MEFYFFLIWNLLKFLIKNISIHAHVEERINNSIDKFEDSGLFDKQVTAQEAFRLYTEQGCPSDLLDINDVEEYNKLIDRHKAISKGKKF